MSDSPIRVLVVDDDFMIAKLHGQYVSSIEGYEWVGAAHSYTEALMRIADLSPHLILLDVYMPDQSGIQLLRRIRMDNKSCDVILITAAKEAEVAEEGFRLGIFDYLIKPFDLDQLLESLRKYALFRSRISMKIPLDQNIVSDLKNLRSSQHVKSSLALQKGIDTRTVEKFKRCLSTMNGYHTVDEIAHIAGVSRSTTRTYLSYFVEEGWLEEELQYGTVGRPQKLYRSRP